MSFTVRAEVSRDILKIRVSVMAFPGVYKRGFPPWTPCCFLRIQSRKTGNKAVKMSLAFKDITQFKGFTGLNLLECAFSVVTSGKQMLNFIQ